MTNPKKNNYSHMTKTWHFGLFTSSFFGIGPDFCWTKILLI